MGTPERSYKYYLRYDGNTYGVLYDDGDKVEAVGTEGGTSIRVSKNWVSLKIKQGYIDISKNKEGFD